MSYSLESLFSIQNEVIIVTGASSGIGQEVAFALAELGARVVCVSGNAERLRSTENLFGANNLSALFCVADVTKEIEINALAEKVMAQFGQVNGLINFAGITKIASLFDFDLADFERILQVNLMGSVICAKVFGKIMCDQKSGRIINISSVRGLQGKANYSAYAASKGAVNTFTKSLALEFAPFGVNVNAIAPIFTATDLNKKSLEDKAHYNWVLSRLPKGRLCEKSELVAPCVFLLSKGSEFVTGEILYVDGGWTAG